VSVRTAFRLMLRVYECIGEIINMRLSLRTYSKAGATTVQCVILDVRHIKGNPKSHVAYAPVSANGIGIEFTITNYFFLFQSCS